MADLRTIRLTAPTGDTSSMAFVREYTRWSADCRHHRNLAHQAVGASMTTLAEEIDALASLHVTGATLLQVKQAAGRVERAAAKLIAQRQLEQFEQQALADGRAVLIGAAA